MLSTHMVMYTCRHESRWEAVLTGEYRERLDLPHVWPSVKQLYRDHRGLAPIRPSWVTPWLPMTEEDRRMIYNVYGCECATLYIITACQKYTVLQQGN